MYVAKVRFLLFFFSDEDNHNKQQRRNLMREDTIPWV